MAGRTKYFGSDGSEALMVQGLESLTGCYSDEAVSETAFQN